MFVAVIMKEYIIRTISMLINVACTIIRHKHNTGFTMHYKRQHNILINN